MTDEAAVEEDISPAQSPLVTLSFQRDDNRKQKYLEAEPKALGITQIALSLFNISSESVLTIGDFQDITLDIHFYISSLLVVIAGIVALAAQNLQLSTLRVGLATQIVACGASIFNIICTLVKMEEVDTFCWASYYHNDTNKFEICQQIERSHMFFYSESALVQVALFAISVTLAVYCCKVVNCCAPKLPVITVQTPATQQRGDNYSEH